MLAPKIVLAFGLAALVAAPASAKDEKIELKKVPAAAAAASRKVAPGVKWTSASVEVENGQTTYYLTGANAEGDDVEVAVTPDGRVNSVATEIAMNEVPKVVLNALKARARGFKPSSAEEVRKDGRLIGYAFEGKTGRDDVEVNVSADGKTVEIDD